MGSLYVHVHIIIIHLCTKVAMVVSDMLYSAKIQGMYVYFADATNSSTLVFYFHPQSYTEIL